MRSAIFALAATTAIAADISVTWRHERSSGSTSVIFHTGGAVDKTLAETCGNSLGSLKFNTDESGVGNCTYHQFHNTQGRVTDITYHHEVTLSDKTFDITHASQDGVSCTRMYNGDVAVIECSNVKVDIPENAATSADCFHDEGAKEQFHTLRRRSAVVNGPKATFEPYVERTSPNLDIGHLRNRQAGCSHWTGYDLVDNPKNPGNAKQNYYLKQLSVSKSANKASRLRQKTDRRVSSLHRKSINAPKAPVAPLAARRASLSQSASRSRARVPVTTPSSPPASTCRSRGLQVILTPAMRMQRRGFACGITPHTQLVSLPFCNGRCICTNLVGSTHR